MNKYLNPNKLKLISKGIDSVKSRVLNLKDKFPHITNELIHDSLINQFLKYHNVTKQETEIISLSDEKNNEDQQINDLYNHYNSWEWKYGECPEFTNSLCYKFEWGLVDLSLEVEKGTIINSVVYSDSLHLDFIEALNNELKNMKGKYYYDHKGFNALCEELQNRMKDNKIFVMYIEEMKKNLIDKI
jgi:lipoate-protein ligase A